MAKVHLIHPDVKKYHKCKQCSGYSFNRHSKLKTHMMAHSRKKPFVCAQFRGVFEPTQGKNLIVVNSASIPAQRQVILRSTCSLIQGKNHSVALSAPIPAQQVVTSNSTWQHIQGRSISAVTSATIHATMLVVWRNTCGSILENNCLYAISAA